jgi:colicin import membrane protein
MPGLAAATLPNAGRGLRPAAPPHLGKSVLLALLAHALLVLALSASVRWRTHDDAVFAAELWANAPRVAAAPAPEPAAPPPVPPPPPVVVTPPVSTPPPVEMAKPQIAVEEEKPKPKPLPPKPEPKPVQKSVEKPADKPPPKVPVAKELPKELPKVAPKPDRAAEAREREREEAALAKQREENLKRMLGQAGGQGSSSQSQLPGADAAPSPAYAGRLRARIKPNLLVTQAVPPDAVVELEVRLAPDGQILSRRVLKRSSSPEWDEAALRGIDRTRVLPRDTDGRVPPVIILSLTPQDGAGASTP